MSGVIVNQFAEGNDHQTVCGSELKKKSFMCV